MATLVVQLARFGDIFQTWPVLKALRRSQPGSELHLLVRERFAEAAAGLEDFGVHVHIWPTKTVLAPLAGDLPEDAALKATNRALTEAVESLKTHAFAKIVNLSFSPFSSYLVDALASPETQVSGYTRHTDGFLAIPDDTSAYFYAQVGIDRPNRYHLCDIFAAVAGVDLIDEDFSHPARLKQKSKSVVVHLGASQADKAYPPELWAQVLSSLSQRWDGDVILIGSPSEREMAEAVTRSMDSGHVINRVGQSSLRDLVQWISEASLLIGADSAPIHIAALVQTPTLNLSCAHVNFWETGPLAKGSRILFKETISDIQPLSIVDSALAMSQNQTGEVPHIKRAENSRSFEPVGLSIEDFEWKLLQALYTHADFPTLPNPTFAIGFQRLKELSELALEQLEAWRQKGPTTTIHAILESVDEMLHKLPALAPATATVIRWFETERLRLGPMDPSDLLARNRQLFEQLLLVASVYDSGRVLRLTQLCARAFREFNGKEASELFLELTGALRPLIENQTSVLRDMTDALESRDWIELADILQFEIPKLVDGARSDSMKAWKPSNASNS